MYLSKWAGVSVNCVIAGEDRRVSGAGIAQCQGLLLPPLNSIYCLPVSSIHPAAWPCDDMTLMPWRPAPLYNFICFLINLYLQEVERWWTTVVLQLYLQLAAGLLLPDTRRGPDSPLLPIIATNLSSNLILPHHIISKLFLFPKFSWLFTEPTLASITQEVVSRA